MNTTNNNNISKRNPLKFKCDFVIKGKSFLLSINDRKDVLVHNSYIKATDGDGVIFTTKKIKRSVLSM